MASVSSTVRRCPTCRWFWTRKPRWYQLHLWPVYWLRCPFLDLFLNDPPVSPEMVLLMDLLADDERL